MTLQGREADDALRGALEATDRFLEGFNRADVDLHVGALAFPHVRLAGGRVRIWEDPAEAARALEAAIGALRERAGWDHSSWDHRRAVHIGHDKVHLDVQFTRWRADGSVIGRYPAVYVVVRAGDRWAIQCRSSFAP